MGRTRPQLVEELNGELEIPPQEFRYNSSIIRVMIRERGTVAEDEPLSYSSARNLVFR